MAMLFAVLAVVFSIASGKPEEILLVIAGLCGLVVLDRWNRHTCWSNADGPVPEGPPLGGIAKASSWEELGVRPPNRAERVETSFLWKEGGWIIEVSEDGPYPWEIYRHHRFIPFLTHRVGTGCISELLGKCPQISTGLPVVE